MSIIFARYFLIIITDKTLPSRAWTALGIRIDDCPVTVSADYFSLLSKSYKDALQCCETDMGFGVNISIHSHPGFAI